MSKANKMKQDVESTPGAAVERLKTTRERVVERLARVQAERQDTEQQCGVLDGKRESLRMRAIAEQDAGAQIDLDQITTSAAVARLRREDLAAVSDALTQELADLDTQMTRAAYHAKLAGFRAMQETRLELARACDADNARSAASNKRYSEHCAAQQRCGLGLGLSYLNRLTDPAAPIGAVLAAVDPDNAVSMTLLTMHGRYRSPLAEQAATLPAWVAADRDPPPGWHLTHHNTDDAPSAATADTAAA